MKKKIRLIWQLYPSYLLMIFLSLFVVSIYTSNYIEKFFLNNTEKDLLTRGQLIRDQIASLISTSDHRQVDAFCKKLGKSSQTRITVILPDGVVIGDSEEDPAMMNNHRNRPEILTALEGTFGSSIRVSETLRIKMMYVTLPLMQGDRVASVIRVALPITSINNTIEVVQARLMLVGIFIAVLASVISLFMSRRISRPIEEMKTGALNFANGQLGHRLHEPSISELASLAEVMNRTAYQLEERIATVRSQRNEYEAVLSSMTEGVVGIDRDQKILTINRAALDMLNADPDIAPTKKGIHEVSRNKDLIQLIERTLASGEYQEQDVTFFRDGQDQTLNIKCTLLKSPEEENIGVLLVLTDVTQLRRLENMRRDFAANVSHEIKTPLTAIKGFVETLRYDEGGSTEDTHRFLSIIDKHVDRLTAIIDDLMQLSRMEQKDEVQQINREAHSLSDLIQASIQHCQHIAEERGVAVTCRCDKNLTAQLDRILMEQAVVNLLDNAVKYSEKGSEVTVQAEIIDDTVRIHVQDEGIGIDGKHHARLFERFYRVDKARSRKLGGTGLGLAIVKHIALAHNGDVMVESKPGQGSRFTIAFPVQPES